MNDQTKRIPAVCVSAMRDASTNNISGLQLVFANGEALILARDALSDDIIARALWHGLKQKLVDAAAISRSSDTGRSATVDDKYLAVKAVFDRLLAGQWNAERGEGGTGAGGLLFRALCIMYATRSPEAIRTFLESKSKAEQAALRKNPRVAAIINKLRAEADDDSINTDELLDELLTD